MATDRVLRVTVVRARPGSAALIEVQVAPGSTLRDAILASGVLGPAELDRSCPSVGVFSRIRPIDSAVRDGDRIEIYRPLAIDPKEARRARAGLRKKKDA